MKYCALLALWLSACGGVVGQGKIGDHDVVVDGTAVAWYDETSYGFTGEGLQLVERGDDDTDLHLLFSGAIFNPTSAQTLLDSAERARVRDDIERSDALHIIIGRGRKIVDDDIISFELPGTVPQSSPFVRDIDFRAAPKEADLTSYPDRIVEVSRNRRGTLRFFALEPRVQGVLDVEFYDDGATAARAEGTIELRFDVEVAKERIAECNFARDQGRVDPCTLLAL